MIVNKVQTLVTNLILNLYFVCIHCLDRHGNPIEINQLLALEATCPESLEFYGSYDPYELSKHPISLYSMYKRWARLKESNTTSSCYSTTDMKTLMPGPTDLSEMGLNLIRLQYTYNLSITDMMKGDINGRVSPWPLTVKDCLKIAVMNHEDLKFNGYEKWHKSCRKMKGYDPDKEKPSYFETQSTYNHLLKLLQKIDHRRAAKAATVPKKIECPITAPNSLNWLLRAKRMLHPDYAKLNERYHQLCSKGSDPGIFENSSNNCYLRSDQHNILAPLKIEVLSTSPTVEIIHNAINNGQIKRIKKVPLENMFVPQELSVTVNQTFANSARTGKTAFISDVEKPGENVAIDFELATQMQRNSARLTGLSVGGEYEEVGPDLFGVEMLQVVSYGIGGQYEPHRDAFGLSTPNITTAELSKERFRHKSGDRIATLIYYLEDVKPVNGGGTVFPELGIAAYPEKGAALFWYNLHRNGQLDQRMIHAGCPVLYGTKWISNHWFRERSQLFNRPCDINPYI